MLSLSPTDDSSSVVSSHEPTSWPYIIITESEIHCVVQKKAKCKCYPLQAYVRSEDPISDVLTMHNPFQKMVLRSPYYIIMIIESKSLDRDRHFSLNESEQVRVSLLCEVLPVWPHPSYHGAHLSEVKHQENSRDCSHHGTMGHY